MKKHQFKFTTSLDFHLFLSYYCHIFVYCWDPKSGDPVQFSSVTRSCLTLCDPINRSTPGLPVHHHPPQFTQTHVHRVSDAIEPSHPLSSPFPPIPNPSQWNSKRKYHMVQQSLSWAYIQNKIWFKRIHALQCSLQHCLQQ